MITIPPILVSSSEVVLEQRPEGKSSIGHLVKGQTVAAKVVQVVSDRRALLMIGGRKLAAKTFLPLQPGQTVLLKVEQTEGRQVFKFVGLQDNTTEPGRPLPIGFLGKEKPYAILSRLFGGIQAFQGDDTPGPGKQLAALKDLVTALSLKSGAPSEGFLSRLMDGSGLLWESKLAALASKGDVLTPAGVERLIAGDLKALALQLLSGSPPGALPAALTEELRGFLESLEQHQLLNQHLAENEGRYLLPIPLGEPPLFKFGQLLLGFGDRKSDGDCENRLVTISFLLSLSRLGELRADFSVMKKSLTGAFGVADEEARHLISTHLPELRRTLKDHGYDVHDISCHILEPQQLSDISLVAQAMTPMSEGFLNLVV